MLTPEQIQAQNQASIDAANKANVSAGIIPPNNTPGGASVPGSNFIAPPVTPPTSTNLSPQGGAQSGADQSKAGTPGYDVFGNKVTTTSRTTPATGTTSPDTGSPILADQTDRTALAQAQADYQTQATQVQNTIANIQNGATPLTAGEQAQVSGLQQQFQQLIDQQQLVNKGASGLANVRGFQSGAAEYDPFFQAKTIGSIVSAGAAKVADLQTKEATAVAQLTQSLKDNDIKAVQDAWSIYQDASKERTDALQKTIADTQQAIKDAATAQNVADQYNLDVAKFNQTGDQNAFDNALKTEQQKATEAVQAETARHNKATEAISAYSAGLGAGGGTPGGVTQSAQLTPTGNPDPATQKAVLDQITQKYGPITAQAIQGLANYSINPADWASRAGTKGLSRADAVSLAQMYDPTYSDTNYPIRAAYLKSISSTQTGTVGSAVNSANKAINHLTAFVTDISKLPNGPISGINALDNTLTLNQGVRQNISAAQTEGLGVAEELAKFFKGSGTVDVASIDAWKSQLSTNASPAQVKGLTQGAITLLAGQLETLTEQYQSTMGKAPETDFLNTSARASLSNLKNQGYEVNIPGINYTDKTAYIKNVPDAQASMTAAVQALTDAGLPLTPENILQAAQSI